MNTYHILMLLVQGLILPVFGWLWKIEKRLDFIQYTYMSRAEYDKVFRSKDVDR